MFLHSSARQSCCRLLLSPFFCFMHCFGVGVSQKGRDECAMTSVRVAYVFDLVAMKAHVAMIWPV